MLQTDGTKESEMSKRRLVVFVNDTWCNPGHVTIFICSRTLSCQHEALFPNKGICWMNLNEALKDCFGSTNRDVFSELYSESFKTLTM